MGNVKNPPYLCSRNQTTNKFNYKITKQYENKQEKKPTKKGRIESNEKKYKKKLKKIWKCEKAAVSL